jgi:hypothetical protein
MRLCRALPLIVLCAAIAAGQETAMLAAPNARDIIRRAAQNQLANEKKARDYTYVQRVEQRKLDGKDAVKSIETTTSEIMVLYGEQVERVIERNDKPLSEKDREKEEDKIKKLQRERQNESEKDREKRLAKKEKQRADALAFVEEIAAAYDFRVLPDEVIEGRPTWVISAEPHPGYQPQRKEARILPKLHGTMWIDKADYAWTKLDAETIDTISFGWFLARLHRGTRIRIEQTRVNDEVWLPRHFVANLDARVALFKNYNMAVDVIYRDYKKFRVDSKMTVLPAAPPR